MPAPDVLDLVRRILEGGGAPQRFADGGLATTDLLAQSPVPYPQYSDWYQRMYGPYGGQATDAVNPITGAPGLMQIMDWIDQGGVGATQSPGVSSNASQGVNSTSNSAGMQAVAAAIGAVSPVPGVVSVANMIANMVSPHSTIGVPGIATVDEAVPGINVNDNIANIDSQTNAAVANNVAVGNMGTSPAPNVGPTPGLGMAQAVAESGTGGGQSAESPGDAPGPDSASGSTSGVGTGGGGGQSDNSFARGGALHQARLTRKASHRPIRRAALGHL
jgi:hypothetical protein